jgi:hypothetical protein
MRELKYHEKKLLKKVDFLNVSPFFFSLFPFFNRANIFFHPFWELGDCSGNRMAIFGRSKSCEDITYKIEMTTANITNCAVKSVPTLIGCLCYQPKTRLGRRWKASCSPSCTTCMYTQNTMRFQTSKKTPCCHQKIYSSPFRNFERCIANRIVRSTGAC